MGLPSTVTSASTHGNSVPNRFFSLSRFLLSFFFGAGGGPPGKVGGAGCMASNSLAGTSRWIDHTLVVPNSAAGFGSSAGVGRESTAANTQAAATTAHPSGSRANRPRIEVPPEGQGGG